MTATKSMIGAESIVALSDEAKALPVILSGVLDKRITELKALIAEQKQRQGIVETMDAAQHEFEKATRLIEDHSQQAMATSNAAAAAAGTLMEQATAKMDAATKLGEQNQKDRDTLAAAHHEVATRAAEITTMRADLNSKVSAMAERSAALDAREKKLKADQATVNARLDALRV